MVDGVKKYNGIKKYRKKRGNKNNTDHYKLARKLYSNFYLYLYLRFSGWDHQQRKINLLMIGILRNKLIKYRLTKLKLQGYYTGYTGNLLLNTCSCIPQL